MRKVRTVLSQRGKSVDLRCMFNENNPVAYHQLEEATSSIDDFEICTTGKDFEEAVPDVVDFIGTSFSLTFIDPTGWKGYRLDKIKPILELKGEVIINFMFDHINRVVVNPTPYMRRVLSRWFSCRTGMYPLVNGWLVGWWCRAVSLPIDPRMSPACRMRDRA